MAKGTMIEGFISMWPREVCDVRQAGEKRLFIRCFQELQKPGVYVLYREDQPYYIGRAEVLWHRLHAHANQTRDRYYNFWNLFSAFVVRDRKYLAEVESILIAAMPTANSSIPRMTKIRMPNGMTSQIRGLRKHQADPPMRREFAALLKISRQILRATEKGKHLDLK
ncbi:MAG: GIY-YIG nuclease family protein [Candidatus Korobacteraceae bacterium]